MKYLLAAKLFPGPAGWGLSDETAIWARRDSGAGPRFEGLFVSTTTIVIQDILRDVVSSSKMATNTPEESMAIHFIDSAEKLEREIARRSVATGIKSIRTTGFTAYSSSIFQ